MSEDIIELYEPSEDQPSLDSLIQIVAAIWERYLSEEQQTMVESQQDSAKAA